MRQDEQVSRHAIHRNVRMVITRHDSDFMIVSLIALSGTAFMLRILQKVMLCGPESVQGSCICQKGKKTQYDNNWYLLIAGIIP